MNFFKPIAHFFSSLFGHLGTTITTILHGISNAVNLAQPIVEEVAAIATGFTSQSALISKLAPWLAVYEADSSKIAAWAAQAENMPYQDVLRSAAALALQTLLPEGTIRSDLNLAVELAYSTWKRLHPAPVVIPGSE